MKSLKILSLVLLSTLFASGTPYAKGGNGGMDMWVCCVA